MNTVDRRVRVRFAPSPTGPLHIGGVRTALYNYLFAKQHGGDFLLRIEDTDQARFVPGAEEYIVEALKWCGIAPDEGVSVGGPFAPYRQSERKNSYKEYALRLIESGYAYYAFDTTEDLDQMRDKMKAAGIASPQYNIISRESMVNSLTLPDDEVQRRLAAGEAYVIRIKIPRKEEIKVVDLIRGNVLVHSSTMDDKVLFKSDGMPTYHLANVVDDYLMNISHVIRGEEWLPSAPLHVLLYRYLGWEDKMPAFAHLPLLLKPEGNGKLSKRDGDRLGFPVFPLEWKDPVTGEISSGYRERGYYHEAVVNMLALLGWNPGTTQEIFSIDELIELFTIERISKSGAKFDFNKAQWINQQYLRSRTDKELATEFTVILKQKGISASEDFIEKSCILIKEKAHLISEFWENGSFLFIAPTSYDDEVIRKKWKDKAPVFIAGLSKAYSNAVIATADEFESVFQTTAASFELNPGQMMQLFRVCLTGSATGPALFEMACLLGAKEVAIRLVKAVQILQQA